MRRLILVPLAVVLAALLVGAIIESGHRARLAGAAAGERAAEPVDPGIAAEAQRIQRAIRSETTCTGAASCDPAAAAARLRAAARGIDAWEADSRFRRVRSTLRSQLLARAAVLDQLVAARADGVVSPVERAGLDQLRERHDAARLDAARAQRAADLIDRATLAALIEELA